MTRTLIPLPLPVAFFYDCPGSNDSDSSWNFGAKFAVDQTFHVMVRPGDTVNISQITGPHAIRVYLGWGGACPGDNPVYGTFRLNFHRFDQFELDLLGHTQP